MITDLTVFEENGIYLADSREVSFLIDKNHKEFLRDIRRYCDYLTESNFALSEYFIENSYKDSTGRDLPCFLCTKKGCDLIANKLDRYIQGIGDSLIRQIMIYRYECNMNWDQIERAIGGNNSYEGLRKMLYRYLKRH